MEGVHRLSRITWPALHRGSNLFEQLKLVCSCRYAEIETLALADLLQWKNGRKAALQKENRYHELIPVNSFRPRFTG